MGEILHLQILEVGNIFHTVYIMILCPYYFHNPNKEAYFASVVLFKYSNEYLRLSFSIFL